MCNHHTDQEIIHYQNLLPTSSLSLLPLITTSVLGFVFFFFFLACFVLFLLFLVILALPSFVPLYLHHFRVHSTLHSSFGLVPYFI